MALRPVILSLILGLVSGRGVTLPRFSANTSCKSIPGDAAWPSTDVWNALNETVNGRLIATVPLPSVCHLEPFGTYNEDACTAIKTAWLDDQTFLNHAAEVMNPYVQNYSCVPFTLSSQPCELGNYASYSINVTGADDVIAGIKFARENNIRLVIKNTGHDFAGKSSGTGALSLWTHHLNTTDIMTSYQSAEYTGPAAKLGAGVIGGIVYEVVGAAGYRMLGGTCPTVGLAGGYTSGAGHSLLNGAYGMAADAVLEWEVITAQGEHLIATTSNNTDLYWALSGGGPGTFGVVLSMTTKIFPDGPIGSGILLFNMTSNATENYWEAIEDLWAFLPQFVDAGPNTWDFALTSTGFQAYAITVPDKKATELASRLIPRAAVLNSTQNKVVVDALRSFVDNEYWSMGCHALNVKDIEHPDNAVLPGWRDAIATCNIVSYLDWNVTQSVMQARKELLVDTLIPALEKATPGAGTYLNEIGAQWKGDWITELYGENYPRLLELKNKYDPDHTFYAWTAIGSDSWVTDGSGRLCRAQ
ncbi:putative FAD-dependent isoamyl alcohol oxidase [Zopfia rhizophila CBS 207.26]|uniref:Putative FAD-dependent isoamyl alcohol oxidase n=1 Tax=Zopfia rhizophila CBS 207.26 TaxID=1314779 RepID=A0A6A6DG83_9PEZI|nr:putative FAD-dependent isoamyl alcohol oxidase [Zopfia rhizophila CBS 207.26]